MASGFIILKDGRCLATRWTAYDYVIELVIAELKDEKKEGAFKEWLKTIIPGKNDAYNGYGGFIRNGTGENVMRFLDLRELTPQNQAFFWKAAQKALDKLITASNDGFDGIIWVLKRFLTMKKLADRGDNPDNLSDWVKGYVEPTTNNKIGPGW